MELEGAWNYTTNFSPKHYLSGILNLFACAIWIAPQATLSPGRYWRGDEGMVVSHPSLYS